MNKNLNYYLNLNYPIEIVKIDEKDGGGYQASVPLPGKYAFLGDGETIEEAIENLNETKAYLFQKYLEKGIPILEPDERSEKEYSGRFILRIPSELHRFLSIEAKKNETTLNQYCLYLLTRKSFLNSIQEELKEIGDEVKSAFLKIKEIDYKFEHSGWNDSAEHFRESRFEVYRRSA